MRIGVVTTSFPDRPGGASGAFVFESARALADLGHEVEVLAPAPSREPHGSCGPPGLTVRWIRYALPRSAQGLCHGAGIPDNVRRRPWRALLAPGLVGAMAAAVSRRSRSWDAAVSHWLLPSGLVTALTARKPHVAVAHSADVWLLGRIPTGPAIVRAVAERSTAVVAVCPQIAEQLDALGAATAARRTAVVPFGPATMPAADAKAATELRRLVGSPRLVVAAIARLVPVKGLDVLLGALARPECAGVGALIAGAGPDGPRLEKLALRSGARARFLGEVSQQGRAELLSAADALVVPSVRLPSGRTEGVPVAALEGLAAGLPVIASSVGGLPWAVGDAGILVEPGSEAALARAMSALERRPDLRAQAARRAKERARDFGWQAAARRLEHLLLEDAHGPLAR